MKPTEDDLRNRFFYHKPDAEALIMHDQINTLLFETAKKVCEICPEGRNLSLAITALEDARMRSNAAIACDRKREGGN